MVAKFLNETDYRAMMFIDADIVFTPEDVGKIWSLDVPFGVGVYPMKKKGSGYAAWINDKLVKDLSIYKTPIEVDYAGTGFMLIRRNVFYEMAEAYPSLKRQEAKVDGDVLKKTWNIWNFFGQMPSTSVWAENDPPIELSEDYAFCKRYKDMGGKIVMDPSVRLKHVGSYVYDGG